MGLGEIEPKIGGTVMVRNRKERIEKQEKMRRDKKCRDHVHR